MHAVTVTAGYDFGHAKPDCNLDAVEQPLCHGNGNDHSARHPQSDGHRNGNSIADTIPLCHLDAIAEFQPNAHAIV